MSIPIQKLCDTTDYWKWLRQYVEQLIRGSAFTPNTWMKLLPPLSWIFWHSLNNFLIPFWFFKLAVDQDEKLDCIFFKKLYKMVNGMLRRKKNKTTTTTTFLGLDILYDIWQTLLPLTVCNSKWYAWMKSSGNIYSKLQMSEILSFGAKLRSLKDLKVWMWTIVQYQPVNIWPLGSSFFPLLILTYFCKCVKCCQNFRLLRNTVYRSVVQLILSLFVTSHINNSLPYYLAFWRHLT